MKLEPRMKPLSKQGVRELLSNGAVTPPPIDQRDIRPLLAFMITSALVVLVVAFLAFDYLWTGIYPS